MDLVIVKVSESLNQDFRSISYVVSVSRHTTYEFSSVSGCCINITLVTRILLTIAVINCKFMILLLNVYQPVD